MENRQGSGHETHRSKPKTTKQYWWVLPLSWMVLNFAFVSYFTMNLLAGALAVVVAGILLIALDCALHPVPAGKYRKSTPWLNLGKYLFNSGQNLN